MSTEQKKCPHHPKYKAIFSPRVTKRFPQGCPMCWELYERSHEKSAEVDDEVVGSSMNNELYEGPCLGPGCREQRKGHVAFCPSCLVEYREDPDAFK